MEKIEIKYNIVAVGNRKICVWDWDIAQQNIEFLDSFEPGYFAFVADTLAPFFYKKSTNSRRTKLGTKIRYYKGANTDLVSTNAELQHAAILLRTCYSHALETLFSLIIATLQSPKCPYAWVKFYNPSELRDILKKIEAHKAFENYLNFDHVTWEKISSIVFTTMFLDDIEKKEKIIENFSSLWRKLAYEFTSSDFTEEYNSIKHGFRISPGGFWVAFGREKPLGVTEDETSMRLLGSSKYGTSHLSCEKIGNTKNHYQFFRKRRNWNPNKILWQLKLISYSIANVVSNLMIIGGKKAEETLFYYPTNLDDFTIPWKLSEPLGGSASLTTKRSIPPEFIIEYSNEQMKEMYLLGEAHGIRTIVFGKEN